jgi:hypothetical protein
MFRTKPEAYSFAIYFLTELNESVQSEAIHTCIQSIKMSFENHEQNPHIVAQHLQNLMQEQELASYTEQLDLLINALTYSPYHTQYLEDLFCNPLPRRFESEIVITLLQHPTSAMMEAVGRVSQEILKVIKKLGENANSKEMVSLAYFMNNLDQAESEEGLGAFEKIPSIQTVMNILRNNDPAELPTILFIHYQFGLEAVRFLPITTAPHRKPTGHLLTAIKALWPHAPEDYFKDAISLSAPDLQDKTTESYLYRALVADVLMYSSDLYRAEPERGRNGFYPGLEEIRSNQMGLMIYGQEEDALGLPRREEDWRAEAYCCAPDFNSRTVKDLVYNDCVYVSGPSGMTAVMLGQMEILANFENVNLKQQYLSAIMAYIVSGGFHGIHEILGPAEYCLRLIPGYKVSAPDVANDSLAEAPNYHTAFTLFSQRDAEFSDRIDQAWAKYMNHFASVYVPNHLKNHPDLFDMKICLTNSVSTSSYSLFVNEPDDKQPEPKTEHAYNLQG